MAGRLPANAIASHRTLAALSAGLLAVSAGAPPVAFGAREADQEQSGAADPGPSNDSSNDPDHDPGGSTATAPDTTDSTAQRPGAPDADPPEPEPDKDTAAQVVDGGDQQDADTDRQRGSTTTQAPGTSATPTTPAGSSSAPSVAAPGLVGQPPQVTLLPRPTSGPTKQSQRRKPTPHVPGSRSVSAPSAINPGLPALQARADQSVAQTSAPIGDAPASGTRAGRGRSLARGARVHVVVAGESLWSIARAVLGPGASNADVAREVHRLWALNAKTIATGNPDLLPMGTELRLR